MITKATPDARFPGDEPPPCDWVFGYGSLMWRPGFEFEEKRPARLPGYHRAFCVYSHYYRGSPENPGLVLGLDKGGLCDGVAFRVAPERWPGVYRYLNERELIGYAYEPNFLNIDAGGETVEAYTFVADRTHPLYAGDLGVDPCLDLIMRAGGEAGLNRDYLMNTVRQLESHGFTDEALHRLLERVRELTGVIDQGAGI